MQKVVHATDNVTTWGCVATDGTQHTTLAALVAAGKTAYPGLDPGMDLASLMIRNENGSGADGAAFYYALNKGTDFSGLANDAARDNVGHLVSGSGQTVSIPGVSKTSLFSIQNVWVRKLTGTDEIILDGMC